MENKDSFEEIEPVYEWQKEKLQDVLEVHLQGFKKEQLRVSVSSLGFVTISGERPVDENRGIHFRKEIKIPEDCKRGEIRAKFVDEILYITMPKRFQEPKQNFGAGAAAALSMIMNKLMKCISGLKCAVPRPQMDGKIALKIGALVAVVMGAAVGAYVAYNY